MPRTRRPGRFVSALVLAAAVAAPALAQPQVDPAARLARAGLTFTADQQQRLAEVQARYAAPAPGDTWRLAAEVAPVLTADQILQLQAATAARRTEAPRARRTEARLDADDRPQRTRSGQAREAMRPHAEAMRELAERHRSGAVTEAEFASERSRLRAERRAAMDARLTPEQRAARDARQARAEAARDARADALGWTDAQQAAVEALVQQHRADAPADREARRARMLQLRAQIEAVYTPEQRAVVAVHRALMGHRARAAMRSPEGARGEARPPRRGGAVTDR